MESMWFYALCLYIYGRCSVSSCLALPGDTSNFTEETLYIGRNSIQKTTEKKFGAFIKTRCQKQKRADAAAPTLSSVNIHQCQTVRQRLSSDSGT